MSRLTGVTRYTPSCLPVDAQLDIHLDVRDFRAKLAFEQIMGGRMDQYAEIAHKGCQKRRLTEAKQLGFSQEQLDAMEAEPEMADYDSLDEPYTKDPEMKLTPDLRSYAELDPLTKDTIRKNVREIPGYLREMGYEIYRKTYRE